MLVGCVWLPSVLTLFSTKKVPNARQRRHLTRFYFATASVAISRSLLTRFILWRTLSTPLRRAPNHGNLPGRY